MEIAEGCGGPGLAALRSASGSRGAERRPGCKAVARDEANPQQLISPLLSEEKPAQESFIFRRR